MGRRLLIASLIAVIGVASLSAAQQPRKTRPQRAPAAPASAPITNDDVIQLVKGGIGDDLIVARIQQTSDRAFDLSTKGMLDLKAAGVSERLMTIMIGGPDPGAAAGRAAPKAASTQQQVVSFASPSTQSVEGERQEFISCNPTK